MITKLVFGFSLAGAAAALVVFAACSSSSTNDFSDGLIEAGTDSGPGPCPQFQFPSTCPVPAPSWETEVRPLVEKYCGQCHQTGSSAAAQLNLSNYSDVYANRTKCWYQIYQCWMPNQDGSPPPMAYPTAAERQTMITWMDVCNAPDN
jgi:hypothetical protein